MRITRLLLMLSVVAMTSCRAAKTNPEQQQAGVKDEAPAALSDHQLQPAPDFTLTDINGKPLSLSSLRGKPVVLDFWGSWCIWCVRGMPKMKEYYQKYAGKFEILGIDCNDEDAVWRQAVNELGLPWLHVYCPQGSDLLETYGIQGFPTKIILDSDGNIYRTIIGEDPQFYEILDEMLS